MTLRCVGELIPIPPMEIIRLMHGFFRVKAQSIAITPSVLRRISKKLDVNVYITGSIRQAGSIIRVNAQMVNLKTMGETMKSKVKRQSSEKILESLLE